MPPILACFSYVFFSSRGLSIREVRVRMMVIVRVRFRIRARVGVRANFIKP
jgi:hypothetical protein